MKGSDLLVSALENEGVERVFGLPGEENLDVVESLRRSSIELIVTRHEQAASFMAATTPLGSRGICTFPTVSVAHPRFTYRSGKASSRRTG
jgi:acetolactate synthase I/II/III large subunit